MDDLNKRIRSDKILSIRYDTDSEMNPLVRIETAQGEIVIESSYVYEVRFNGDDYLTRIRYKPVAELIKDHSDDG